MAQNKRRRRRRRRKRDRVAIVLRLIIFLLIVFIVGLIAWFILHDRNLRSGVTALKQEKYDEAITCFDDSIAEDKNVAEAWRGKGIAYFEQKKYKEAAEAFETSSEEGGIEDAQFCNLLALSYMHMGKDEDAIIYLEKGLSESDASEELIQQMRFQLIHAYENTAQWDEAKENAESYMTDYPDDQKMSREYEFLKTR